jgi:hypothetical protein
VVLRRAADPDVGFALIRDGDGQPYFALVRFDGTVFSDACLTAANEATFGAAPEPIEATAGSFIEHIRSHPFVTSSEPVEVEYGGLAGLAMDVSVDVPVDCEPPWAWLWTLPVVGDCHLADGQSAHLVALQARDQVIVASSEVFEGGDLDAFVGLTDAILASLEVGETG